MIHGLLNGGNNMTEIKNPFSYDRFEKEENPIIYFPTRFERFKTGKNYYLQGGRGTGKTAILRSFFWKDRISESTFKMKPKEFQREKIIGLYIRVPDYQVPNFKGLSDNEEFRNTIFSTYLVFIQLELLFNALSSLSLKFLPISAAKEVNFCEKLKTKHSDIFLETDNIKKIKTFIELKNAFYILQSKIRILAIRDLQPNYYPDIFLKPSSELLYDFTSDLIEKIAELKNWKLFFCIDEAEAFKDWQQLILNSLVRKSKKPWSYLIAFVEGTFNLHKTIISNQALGDADRTIDKLDELNKKDFNDFANGVIKKRIATINENLENIDQFDIESIIGKYTVNDLLVIHLKKSLQQKARDLLENAEKNRERYQIEKNESPPIYETWIESFHTEKILRGNENKKEKRRISSAKLRKFHLSTYHNISLNFGFEPLYIGKDAILGLSDQCVRDLLRVFFFLFEESRGGYNWKEYPLKYIDIDIQKKAVKQAANSKMESIEDEVIYNPPSLRNLIKNIGDLLKKFIKLPNSLFYPDYGIIFIPKSIDLIKKEFRSIFEEGRYCGIIHVEEEIDAVKIRLHSLLNVDYKLPYRRPKRYIRVDYKYLTNFVQKGLSESVSKKLLKKFTNNKIEKKQIKLKKS